MRKLLTLALLSAFLTFNEAKAGEGEAIVQKRDCVAMIIEAKQGKNKQENFLDAVQKHLEDGYKGNDIFLITDPRSSRKILYTTVYKEDC